MLVSGAIASLRKSTGQQDNVGCLTVLIAE
jgi:hypothetical protein